jgi:choline kinase
MVKNNYKAVILLAGGGTRLLPLSLHTPKSLLIVGQYPLLWYSITNLLSIGVTQFCFVVGFKAPLIKKFITSYFPGLDATFIYNDIYQKTNSIYSYYLARKFFRNSAYFRLDGDIFYSSSILKLLIRRNKPIIACIKQIPNNGKGDYVVQVDRKNKTIKKYGKNIDPLESFGEAMAIEFISKESSTQVASSLTSMIKQGTTNDYAEAAYQSIANKGGKINYVIITKNDYWYEVDTEKDLKSIRKIIKTYAPSYK